jgi:LytS/YehU family sensor histidine kinase
MASESLAKFSELLRYQLYECNEQQIPVTQELQYLENFIELQKLRQDGNVEMKIHLNKPDKSDLSVAPFIVMPFVENAFKHVSQHKNSVNWIVMNCRFDDHQWYLEISNSVSNGQAANEAVSYRGIGLRNVQRRLDLLYPNQYELSIKQDKDQFRVNLKLKLIMQKTNISDAMQMA